MGLRLTLRDKRLVYIPFYHNLILKPYSNIYYLILLFDIVIVNIDKVVKIGRSNIARLALD